MENMGREDGGDPQDKVALEEGQGPSSFAGQVSGSLQEGMQRRATLSSHLKTMISEEDLPSFGPGHPGCLFKLKAEDMERGGVLSREVLEHLPLPLFVTLRYVEGLKYTLGTKYISRRSQGEFVFMDLKSGSSDSDGLLENYMSLECKEETLWISSHGVEGLCASSLILVNGAQLTINDVGKEADNLSPDILERDLVFGDLISIFVSDEGGGGNFVDLVFQPPFTTGTGTPRQEMTASDNDTDESHGIEFKLLTNPLIAEKILYFLPTKSIKSLRSVSQLWNVEGLKVLRNRVVITPFSSSGPTNSADRLMEISNYANSQLRDLKFPYWKIPYIFAGYRNQDKHAAMKEMKLLEDVIWLFDPAFHTHRVQSVTYEELLSDKSCGILGAVLRGVKDTLDTLNFSLYGYSKGLRLIDVQSLSGIDLPRLKSLELFLYCSNDNDDIQSAVRPLIQAMLQAANSIKMLTLGGDYIHSSSDEKLSSLLIMEEMVKLQSAEPSRRFPNLTNIKANFDYESFNLLPLSSLRVGGLKKLQLHKMPEEIDLRPGLQAHADTLEELDLQFDADEDVIKVDLPKRMPKLKRLSLFNFTVYNESPTSLRLNVGQWDDQDAAQRRLDFGRHFPSLSSLTVWPVGRCEDFEREDFEKDGEGVSWGKFWPLLVPFVGTPADVDGPVGAISSLRNLDIPFVLDGKYHPRLDNLETLFPNVVFTPELAEARLGPVWTDEDE